MTPSETTAAQTAPRPASAGTGRSVAPAAARSDRVVLQELIYPEQSICTERDLYVRLGGAAGLSETEGTVSFGAGGTAEFNTYFNLFPIGKWARHCALTDIRLALTGTGRFEVSVFLAIPDRSWERLATEVTTLSETAPVEFDLSHFEEVGIDGVLFFEVKALKTGTLTGAAWQTAQRPRRVPELMLSVTTFRREAAVARTARRFGEFIAGSALKDHIRMLVVDNGQTAEIAESAHVTRIDNANLGGAGGFARGLIEAGARGNSHCLFMDDDATIHMQSLERTWQFLAFATDPATAVAGAMINASHRWAIWENGAVFNTRCIPCHMGVDLRDPRQVFEMEFDTIGTRPANFYGGWWFFAFPVNEVRHLPFPFFVRGDDVSFSLAHDFNILTLPGVVSFQDSFTDKESPLTWYLDLRSHLVHHLALPHMAIGGRRTLKIAVWFFMRNVLRLHYDTLSAVNLALEDVLEGPDFFASNADMAQRRADLKALVRDEAWVPVDPDRPPDRVIFNPHRWLPRTLMKLTLNGFLLPGFRLYGNRITLEAEDRGNIRAIWGAAEITYLDARRRNGYTVRHSKRRAWREGMRMIRNGRRFLARYDSLTAAYRDGYGRLTSDRFWAGALSLPPAPLPDSATQETR